MAYAGSWEVRPIGSQQYRIGELAAATGISVRTLHHYDHIGLLRPSARTEGGQRRYGERDLLRLQQIMTLRLLGFSLKEIATVLDQPHYDLVRSLGIQWGAIRMRIAALQQVEGVLYDLLGQYEASGVWSWQNALQVAAAAHKGMERQEEWMNQFLSDDERKDFEAWQGAFSPEEIKQGEERWAALVADMTANLNLAPTDPAAVALVERWDAMVEYTFQGHTAWKGAVARQFQNNPDYGNFVPRDVWDFLERVRAARKG